MNETEIFLSYAREDESEVERILHALRERGFRVFFDQECHPAWIGKAYWKLNFGAPMELWSCGHHTP